MRFLMEYVVISIPIPIVSISLDAYPAIGDTYTK